jgi:ABC-type transport system substrate-binding protein
VALSSRPSGDLRVWRLRLRPGIRFQDGEVLDASAVLANAERWRTSPVGRRLLPGLIAADGPRPDLVRFVFSAPVPDLPRRLGDPRLGLVSPAVLTPPNQAAATLGRATQAGSGPFELAGRSGAALILRRNRAWWGGRQGLGPALDTLAFRPVADRAHRLALLRRGSVRVAGDLVGAAAKRLQGAPLLTAVGVKGPYPIGFERSVRGIDTWRPQSLSGVWLALLGQAG